MLARRNRGIRLLRNRCPVDEHLSIRRQQPARGPRRIRHQDRHLRKVHRRRTLHLQLSSLCIQLKPGGDVPRNGRQNVRAIFDAQHAGDVALLLLIDKGLAVERRSQAAIVRHKVDRNSLHFHCQGNLARGLRTNCHCLRGILEACLPRLHPMLPCGQRFLHGSTPHYNVVDGDLRPFRRHLHSQFELRHHGLALAQPPGTAAHPK